MYRDTRHGHAEPERWAVHQRRARPEGQAILEGLAARRRRAHWIPASDAPGRTPGVGAIGLDGKPPTHECNNRLTPTIQDGRPRTEGNESLLFPTLTARDDRGAGISIKSIIARMKSRKKKGLQLDLPTFVKYKGFGKKKTGMISPYFCEKYMGFPIGWTELERSETP